MYIYINIYVCRGVNKRFAFAFAYQIRPNCESISLLIRKKNYTKCESIFVAILFPLTSIKKF